MSIFARLASLDDEKEHVIACDTFIIGRNTEKCDLLVDYEDISKIHCVIRKLKSTNGAFIIAIQDCSSNGTYLDGNKLPPGRLVPLENGTVISLAISKYDTHPDDPCYLVRAFFFFEVKSDSFFATYTLGHHLGRGGFGRVMEAHNTLTGEVHAVKIARNSALLSEAKATIIRREVEILGQLCHPHIVRFHQTYQEDSFIYLVMELIAAGDLRALIYSNNGIADSNAKIVTLELTLALQYMHSKHIVHRDIKPQNILVTSKVPIHIKVTDFGLAKSFEGSNLRTVCGTSPYMAPEVLLARGDAQMQMYNSKVDSWGTGVTLFEMLLCFLPFPFLQGNAMPTKYEQYDEIEWKGMSKSISADARDLISCLLIPKAELRFSIMDTLRHPWCCAAIKHESSGSAGESSSPVPLSTADSEIRPPVSSSATMSSRLGIFIMLVFVVLLTQIMGLEL